MSESISNCKPDSLLEEWLKKALPEESAIWLQGSLEKALDLKSDQGFYVAFGMAPRKLGKDLLKLTTEDIQLANEIRKGWCPQGMSVDQAARLLMTLRRLELMGDRASKWLDQLFATADVAEQVVLYRGLPLYPQSPRLVLRAQEGLRSNIKTVFEAIAHNSPFPEENFGENAWNHMVLKALFIGSPLYPVQGLDRLSNPQLTRMLSQYAHERWAAKRTISPELWRCVGNCPQEGTLEDLKKVLTSKQDLELQAGVMALYRAQACGFEEKKVEELLRPYSAWIAQIDAQELTWTRLGWRISESLK